MESLDPVSQETLSYDESLRLDDEVSSRWSAIPTIEPISDDLRELVRADLQKRWFFNREWKSRHETKTLWNGVDEDRTVLKDSVGQVESRHIKYICNKATALYWLQSAQHLNAFGERSSLRSVLFAALYEEWNRCYAGKAHIDFGHFFANPVRITSSGPSTVQGILDAHRSLQTQVLSLIHRAKDGTFELSGHLPSTLQYHSILPLYRAIVVIADCTEGVDGGVKRESNGWISLYKVARRQTVLLVRTGDEEDLSAPISFAELRPHILPMERDDVLPHGLDAVRVTLATAVKFLVGLETREALAAGQNGDLAPLEKYLCPSPYPEGLELGVMRSHEECAKEWADALVDMAEKDGYDNHRETWQSVRRVRAGLVGEPFRPFEHVWDSQRWK